MSPPASAGTAEGGVFWSEMATFFFSPGTEFSRKEIVQKEGFGSFLGGSSAILGESSVVQIQAAVPRLLPTAPAQAGGDFFGVGTMLFSPSAAS